MNKHQPDHEHQHANDNVIAFPASRRVRPPVHTIEINGVVWSMDEWDAYEASRREFFGF